MASLAWNEPIPVLLVGPEAAGLADALSRSLSRSGDALGLSCAAFDDPVRAADAAAGARLAIVVASGADADALADHAAWQPWREPGAGLARIVIGDGVAAAPGLEILPVADPEALAALLRSLGHWLIERASRERTTRALETEHACVPLFECLDPGKLYTMALDLLLSRLGRRRGIALFAPSPAPQSPGVACRGFDEDVRDQVARQLVEEKSTEAAMGQGVVSVVPWGPLHAVLSQVGMDASGAMLSVPLRGDEVESGHVWVLSDQQRFSEEDLDTARTIALRACQALATAERYHHAKERAFIDDVTGVYNARYLLATADNEIQRAARYGNPLSVLFLDLDRFKSVNDRFGHLVGSDTLRSLAKLLGECVRQVDTLARYGGDEFTILLVDTPHETALLIAERIRARVEAHLFEAGREGHHQLTISIGVATCPGQGQSRERLLDAADKAMYLAKSQGRNRVCSAATLVAEAPAPD